MTYVCIGLAHVRGSDHEGLGEAAADPGIPIRRGRSDSASTSRRATRRTAGCRVPAAIRPEALAEEGRAGPRQVALEHDVLERHELELAVSTGLVDKRLGSGGIGLAVTEERCVQVVNAHAARARFEAFALARDRREVSGPIPAATAFPDVGEAQLYLCMPPSCRGLFFPAAPATGETRRSRRWRPNGVISPKQQVLLAHLVPPGVSGVPDANDRSGLSRPNRRSSPTPGCSHLRWSIGCLSIRRAAATRRHRRDHLDWRDELTVLEQFALPLRLRPRRACERRPCAGWPTRDDRRSR